MENELQKLKIKDYIKEYTAGNGIYLMDVLGEVKEFLVELIKLNRAGMSEEFQDIFHFLQLWLFWRFGIDGKIWSITKKSVVKFINRKEIWQKIYVFVGLNKEISGYVGNYKKIDKVTNHLSKFGINQEKAEEAYNKIVLGVN